MSKKKPEKEKKIKSPKAKDVPKQPDEDTAEKPFDFGGLPDRDLKKNLGCG